MQPYPLMRAKPDQTFFAAKENISNDLANLPLEIDKRVAELKTSLLSSTQRNALLLDGAQIGDYTTHDVAALMECPEPPASHRTPGVIIDHLRLLCMPRAQEEARQDLLHELNIDDEEIAVAAKTLSRLDQNVPDAVTAFLKLEIREGGNLLAQHTKPHLTDEEKTAIVRVLLKVRWAYLLRTAAMHVCAELRRPTGFSGIDDLGNRNSPRCGEVIRQFEIELQILDYFIDLFEAGTDPVKKVNVRFDHILQKINIKRKAERQLLVWQAKYGKDLEAVLIAQISYIKKRARKIAREVSKLKARTEVTDRIAYLDAIAPLPVLYNLVRFAAATMLDVRCERDAGDTPKVKHRCGLDDIIAWAMMSPGNRGIFPMPVLQPKLTEAANEIFATLRFAIVRDESMFPARTREWASSFLTAGGKAPSAAQVRERLYERSFESLKDDFAEGNYLGDVWRHADPKARNIFDFDPSMRAALRPWLTWYESAL